MAGVNGVEIKVGQVWRTRGGEEAKVLSEDSDSRYPFNLKIDGVDAAYTSEGRCWFEAEHGEDDDDLIELVKDENGFTIWRGGEQPPETVGRFVTFVTNEFEGWTREADLLHWAHNGSRSDIVAYKVVEQPADSATLAEETLSALGWTFDGQAWTEQPKAELPIGMVPNALDVQVGGTHYKDMTIQPWAAFDSWLSTEQHVGYLLGTAIAYLARFNSKGVGKGGLVDVEKATHTLQRLVEVAKKGSANED